MEDCLEIRTGRVDLRSYPLQAYRFRLTAFDPAGGFCYPLGFATWFEGG